MSSDATPRFPSGVNQSTSDTGPPDEMHVKVNNGGCLRTTVRYKLVIVASPTVRKKAQFHMHTTIIVYVPSLSR